MGRKGQRDGPNSPQPPQKQLERPKFACSIDLTLPGSVSALLATTLIRQDLRGGRFAVIGKT
jgi:hypothetical protein